MYCAPLHTSNTQMQYAWAWIRGGGRPQKAVPTEERKGARFGKRPLQLREDTGWSRVTKTQHKRTQAADL